MAGSESDTSTVLHPVSLRELEVVRVENVNDALRRVVVTGDEMGAFVRDGSDCGPFVTAAFDDHVKVFLERDGDLVLPEQQDGHLHWPDDPPPLPRDYTVRSFDATTRELTVDALVDHGGPGASWASSVEVGDVVFVAGPRNSHIPPTTADAVVLIADLSAVPAVDRYLDAPPIDAPTTVVAIAGDDDIAHLRDRGADVHLLEPSSSDDELLALIDERFGAAIANPDTAWAWAACEFELARGIRRVLKDRGLDKSRTAVTHYWKRGVRAEVAHEQEQEQA